MILTILAAFLVWEVITRSIAASLADTSPEVSYPSKFDQSERAVEPCRCEAW